MVETKVLSREILGVLKSSLRNLESISPDTPFAVMICQSSEYGVYIPFLVELTKEEREKAIVPEVLEEKLLEKTFFPRETRQELEKVKIIQWQLLVKEQLKIKKL